MKIKARISILFLSFFTIVSDYPENYHLQTEIMDYLVGESNYAAISSQFVGLIIAPKKSIIFFNYYTLLYI